MHKIPFHYLLSALLLTLFLPSSSELYKEGKHVPLAIILEQGKSENPEQRYILAMTAALDQAIKEQNAPILVSRQILYNFVVRKHNRNDPDHPGNKYFANTKFSSQEFELYSPTRMAYFTGDEQLYLLIPLALKTTLFNSTTFKLNALKKITLLPEENNGDYTPLIELIKPTEETPKTKNTKLLPLDFAKIFATSHKKNGPIWDIVLTGHGSPKPNPYIADLDVTSMQKLLSFFNDKINVGILLIGTCYAGGENLHLLTLKKDINNDAVFAPLNFTIIVDSVGDTVKFSPLYDTYYATGKSFFASVFDIMQNLGKDDEHTLEILLRVLTEVEQTATNVHMQSNIPQIILPGGIEIQSLTPDERVMVLGKVKTRVAELEKKPIKVYPYEPERGVDLPLNVLIYAPTIQTTLLMRASRQTKGFDLELFKPQWEHMPTLAELLTEHKKILQPYPIISSKIVLLKNKKYLYPNIISMIHGKASHYIRKIVFEGSAYDGSGGVLKGIRDAFWDLGERPTIKTFFIDSIEGSNDISLILKISKLLQCPEEASNPTQPDPLLPFDGIIPDKNETVVLRNVFIRTLGEGKKGQGIHGFIKFQIDDTAWRFAITGFKPNLLWECQKVNARSYEADYTKAKKALLKRSIL